MFPFDWSGSHGRRTREHVIEEMSVNFLERKVLQRGHQLVPAIRREYGCDATMFHFSPKTGAIENGEIRFQLKATDHLDRRKKHVTCRVSTKHLHYWYWEAQQFPFVLVLYDAKKHEGYWIAIRQYVDDLQLDLSPEQQTIEIQIPWKNKITVRTVDMFRALSLQRINREA